MSKDLKAGLGWWGFGVLIIIFATLSGCARTITEAPIITGQLAPPNLGVTVCSENDYPIIVIKEEIPRSPLREVVIFHEQVHVRQIASFGGGCRRFMGLYSQSKVFRVGKELEAYCLSLNFATNELGANGQAVLDDIERVMRFHFDTTGVSCRGHYAHRTDSVGAVPQRQVSRGASVSEVRHPP